MGLPVAKKEWDERIRDGVGAKETGIVSRAFIIRTKARGVYLKTGRRANKTSPRRSRTGMFVANGDRFVFFFIFLIFFGWLILILFKWIFKKIW